MKALRLVMLIAMLAPGTLARAHEFSPGFLGFTELAPGEFRIQWKVSLTGGLADVLTPQLPEECTFSGALSAYVMGDARVQQRDVVCAGELAGREIGIAGLERTMTDVLLRIDYLDGASFTALMTPSAPATTIPAAQGALAVAWAYFVLGVEHILIGIDHLLFVLALLLLVEGLRRLVLTVTAFTIAHSITLGAAALDLVHVAQAPVEAVIALSILFLASELARGDRGADGQRDLATRFPWLVAFVFGLLHGFGFAGALAEIGMPQRAVPLALLSFNLGVEAGQLLFIFAVLGAVFVWHRARLPAPAILRRAAVYGIGSVAAFWVVERTVGAF